MHWAATLQIDQAGCTNAQSEQRSVCFGGQRVDQLVHQLDGGRAASPVTRHVQGAADLAAQIDDRTAKVGAGQVDTNQVPSIGSDTQQDGRLAQTRPTATDLLDQPALEQLADRLADRCAREACSTGLGGATDLTSLVDGAQHEAVVVGFGLLLGGFATTQSVGHTGAKGFENAGS